MDKKKKARKTARKEPRLPAEKISELALGIFKGEIFTSAQVGESERGLLPVIFMPLALLVLAGEERKKIAAHPPTLLCGRVVEALPRSINGYPIFTNMQMVYAQDAKLILALYRKFKAATEEILETESGRGNALRP
jgi:hypothetical protein